MSVLIERVVRVNGEERQRSQVVAEHSALDKIIVPIATIQPPLLEEAKVELELTFDPPLVTPQSGAPGDQQETKHNG